MDKFKIDFYRKADGSSEVLDFMEELRHKAKTSKDARIQYKQIRFYINLLSSDGTSLGINYVKQIEDTIWELRPGNNRIFYFFYDSDGCFVLLHHYRKKTEETPKREIEKAKRERDDHLRQKKEGKK